MKKLWEKEVSRRKLLGGVAATGAAIPVLHELVPHAGLHDSSARAQAVHAGHKVSDSVGSPRRSGEGRPEGQRLRPAGDPARLRHRHAAQRRARVGDRGRGPRDRGGPRGQVRGLDLQRARARAHAARPRGRAAAHPLHQRVVAPAHDALPRHPPRPQRRRSPASAPATSALASRRTTSSTPRPSASTFTTATRPRWRSTSPRGSTARSSSTPRSRASRPTSS